MHLGKHRVGGAEPTNYLASDQKQLIKVHPLEEAEKHDHVGQEILLETVSDEDYNEKNDNT